MLHGTGLTRQPAAAHGGNHVKLTAAVSDREGLVDHQTQRRTREIGFLILAIDDDLAGTGLDPYAGNGILAAAGGVGTALRIDFTVAQRHCHAGDFSSIALRRVASDFLQIGEIGNGGRFGGGFFSHYATTLFLRFMEATSSTVGF